MLAVGFLGPSVAEPPLPHRGLGPPYYFSTHASAWLVMALLFAALSLGSVLLVVSLRALRAGWRPTVRGIVLMGVIGSLAFLLCPPLGSADYTNYSAYGHIENRGLDAYLITPLKAAKLGVPTASAVEPPWQKTQSVYGPTSLRIEQVAAWLGGASLKRTSLWLSILHCLAYLLTGAILLTMATTEAARRRVAALWFANPLMIYELVAGSHVDALVVLLVVAGLAVFRRSRLMAGLLVGLGVATKVNAAVVGGAMAWADRKSPKKLCALALGAALAIGGLYLTASSHALDQTRRASRFVSAATPWWVVVTGLRHLIGRSGSQVLMTMGVAVLAVFLGRAIFRLIPAAADTRQDAVRSAFGYSLAYLFAAPYLLAWYDSLAWGTIPLLEDGPLDLLLVAHTTVLAFAALPGRDLPFPTSFKVVVFILHSVVAPMMLLIIIILTIRRARQITSPHVQVPDQCGPPVGLDLVAATPLLESGEHVSALETDGVS